MEEHDLGEEAWAAYTSQDEGGNTSHFTEGILSGYHWYDAKGIEPLFDFGYGLSYTTFAYDGLTVTERAEEGESIGLDVRFTVTNTGSVTGSEVAQVYLGEVALPEGLQSAKVQLAGYQKVKDLAPGEAREVTIHVSERALSFWNSDLSEL